MHNRYLARVILTSLALSLAFCPAAPARTLGPACRVQLRDLYAPRALRRLRTILQMRVLEARRERLSLARAAIENRAAIDALLAAPDDAEVLAKGPNAADLKHLRIPRASNCW
jgi:hypothetical protein